MNSSKEDREFQTGVCNALAHPVRLKILEKLRGGPCCVCKIIPYVGAEQSNVSHHLAILKNAGLVRSRKQGMEVWYEVRNARIFEVLDMISDLVTGQLEDDHRILSRLIKVKQQGG